jgi:rhodanese-related sulfurtransferase
VLAVDLETARNLLDQGALLLDVRSDDEYAELGVPGAVHVSTGKAYPGNAASAVRRFLPALLALVHWDLDRPLLVYCKAGRRSQNAVSALRRAGFRRVYNLGGLETEPLRSLVARRERLWRRPPPDMRPILYQFFRDHPYVQPGDGAWQRLAWSMGLSSGAAAEQLAYQALGATVNVPGLGPYQPYRRQALLDFTRAQVRAQVPGADPDWY